MNTFKCSFLGQRGILGDTPRHTAPSPVRFFCSYFVFCVFFSVFFLVLGGCKGKGQIWRDGEVNEIGVHDMTFTKNLKIF